MRKMIKQKLIDIVSENNVIENANMAEYTSFKAGGSASLLVEPANTEELKDVAPEVYAIGDVARVKDIQQANNQAFFLARDLGTIA